MKNKWINKEIEYMRRETNLKNEIIGLKLQISDLEKENKDKDKWIANLIVIIKQEREERCSNS